MAMEAFLLPDGGAARPLGLERVKVRLRLREEAEFSFHHGGLLHGLTSRLGGGQPPAGLLPLPLESGHVAYAAGDAYDFALAAAGEDRRHLARLEGELRAGGAARPRRTGSRCESLEGLFDLESVTPLPLPGLEQAAAKADELAARGRVRLLLASPLRLRRPAEKDPLAAQSLGAGSFPAGLLLASLLSRYRLLAGLPASPSPALPENVRASAEKLCRLDLPLRLNRQSGSGPAPAVLNGLGGELVFENLPRPWLLLLALLEGAHAGIATEFGFGSFALEQLESWRRPAIGYQEAQEARWPEELTSEAAARLLQPAALVQLDEGPASQSRGLAQVTAELGLLRARNQGLNGAVGGAGDLFLSHLGEARILARLRALWPGEPLVERFPAWLSDPAERPVINRLLAKIFAVELADHLEAEGRRLVRMGSELRVYGRQAARVA